MIPNLSYSSSQPKLLETCPKLKDARSHQRTRFIPEGYPVPGENIVYDTSEKIDLDNVPLNGGILLKTLEVSVDPYMRGRMRDASIESYVPAFQLNESITGFGVAVVVRSESSEAKKGDYVSGMIQYQNYSIVKDLKSASLSKFVNSENLPLSTYIGVLGMPVGQYRCN